MRMNLTLGDVEKMPQERTDILKEPSKLTGGERDPMQSSVQNWNPVQKNKIAAKTHIER